ncbi:cobalt-precorrin 5A hydrolase [Methanosphaera cuniculi]|uniref:cobalt-precorrin 5A hydrolase n=1 Tax=Methanosphaera cuniculi TaxID=1077256 RepID=UPI0026F17E4A|nr:cobalt-precorrin 5A hydrolase [Methanosphaera cuniculi]
MKIAIISITTQGKNISDKIYEQLIKDPTILHIQQYHKNVKQAIKETFNTYDCIIAIMASGIIIRSIAPYVNSKLTDPAVLLIDDNANYTISLLSGHMGGANNLTHKISQLIGSTPVITTSTDVNQKQGIDEIARKYYFNLENPENIKYINRALVDNRKPTLQIPIKYTYLIDEELKNSYDIKQDNTNDMITATIDNHSVILTPQNLVMGIGARRDIAQSKVEHAINTACQILEIPPQRIDEFATVDIKQNEDGIIKTVENLGKQIQIVPRDTIETYKNDQCSKSDFVMKQFGIKGVCEPTSLIINGENSELIFKKTAYDGVTIAVSKK